MSGQDRIGWPTRSASRLINANVHIIINDAKGGVVGHPSKNHSRRAESVRVKTRFQSDCVLRMIFLSLFL
jgi:hypothetical protein